jgi:hypothetical protein
MVGVSKCDLDAKTSLFVVQDILISSKLIVVCIEAMDPDDLELPK